MLKRSPLILLVVCLLVLPSLAFAGSVKVGGALRFELSYIYDDDDASATGDSVFELDIFHMSTSNLTVTYLSDDKKFEAYVEIGLLSRSQGNNVYTRRAWFGYNWEGGSILFGQTGSLEESYFPASILNGTGGILGFGKDWWDRPEQIRLTLGDKYKLKVALEAPTHTGDYDLNGDGAADGLTYFYFPAFAASLDLSFGNVNVYPWARWEWHRLELAAGDDVNWHSLEFGLEIAGNFGLVGFTVGASYSINGAGTNPVAGLALPVFDAAFDQRADHKQFRCFGDLRIGGFHLGGGYAQAQIDDLNGVDLWAGDPSTASVYANYWIDFGKITFVPELVWYRYGESTSGQEQGNRFRFGLYAVLNF